MTKRKIAKADYFFFIEIVWAIEKRFAHNISKIQEKGENASIFDFFPIFDPLAADISIKVEYKKRAYARFNKKLN